MSRSPSTRPSPLKVDSRSARLSGRRSRGEEFRREDPFPVANSGLLAGNRLAWFAHDLSISDTSVFPDGSLLDAYNVILMDGIISNGIHALQDRSSPAH